MDPFEKKLVSDIKQLNEQIIKIRQKQVYWGANAQKPVGEFNPATHIMVGSNNDRAALSGNFGNIGVTVKNQYGRPIDRIMYGQKCSIEAQVFNIGDLDAPSARVELWVNKPYNFSQESLICIVDSIKIRPVETPNIRVHEWFLFGRVLKGELCLYDQLLIENEIFETENHVKILEQQGTRGVYSPSDRVSAGKKFKIRLGMMGLTHREGSTIVLDDENMLAGLVNQGDIILNNRHVDSNKKGFRATILGVFPTAALKKKIVRIRVDQGQYNMGRNKYMSTYPAGYYQLENPPNRIISTGEEVQLTLIEKQAGGQLKNGVKLFGRYFFGIENNDQLKAGYRRVDPASYKISDFECIRHHNIFLPGKCERKTVNFDFIAGHSLDRLRYRFAVRAYNMFPKDFPGNADSLNPFEERHVGMCTIDWAR